MQKQLSADVENHEVVEITNVDSQNSQKTTDSQNSERSEPGSRIIITSKSSILTSKVTKNCTKGPLCNDSTDTTAFDTGPPLNGPCLMPTSDVRDNEIVASEVTPILSHTLSPPEPVREIPERAEQYSRRVPSRTSSTPNLSNNNAPLNFQTGLRRRRMANLRSQSVLEMKHDGVNPYVSTTSRIPRQRIRTEPPPTLRNKEPTASGVFGLLSRLTSLMGSRSLGPLDEQVLNNFNLEVGTVTSRVDMWRQKLDDERSLRSQTRSVEIASTNQTTANGQAYAFISGEIQYLVQLTSNLTQSLFGGFSWGILGGMEGRLITLLEMGSNIVFPVAEVMIMHIWRMLREILDLHWDDTEKVGGLRSVVEAINNAFYAIRSLIHLGYAYRNAREPSDREYIGDETRSLLDGSLANFDQKEEEQKYD